jgi:hypothetical protein
VKVHIRNAGGVPEVVLESTRHPERLIFHRFVLPKDSRGEISFVGNQRTSNSRTHYSKGRLRKRHRRATLATVLLKMVCGVLIFSLEGERKNYEHDPEAADAYASDFRGN